MVAWVNPRKPQRFAGVGLQRAADIARGIGDGDEIHCVTIAYSSRDISGALQTDPSESLGFAWIYPRDHFDNIAGNYRRIVEDYLAG